ADPDAAVTKGHRARAVADRNGRNHLVRLRVDPGDGAGELACDPYRLVADGDPRRAPPDADRLHPLPRGAAPPPLVRRGDGHPHSTCTDCDAGGPARITKAPAGHRNAANENVGCWVDPNYGSVSGRGHPDGIRSDRDATTVVSTRSADVDVLDPG